MSRLFFVIMLIVADVMSAFFISTPASAQNTGTGMVSQAEVRIYKGSPTMFVDGNPTAAMTYTVAGNRKDKFFRDFGNAGVNFVSTGISPTTLPVWKGPDDFDFRSIDEIMKRIVKNNPDALIFPRVWLFSPPWWNERNPDELMRFHDGTTKKDMMRLGGREFPSWASDKWREDASHCIHRMIEHIQKQPYGGRVVGYHLSSGGTGEWYYYSNFVWFFNEQLENYLDYSRPQTEAFREWLRKKYESLDTFRTAWHNDTVTFETAEIAPKKDKQSTDHFLFFDPARSQHVIDTYDFEAELVADTIAYFCKAVKDASGGHAFTGAFYGYVTGAVDKVYLATHSLLQCPDIDFITSPSAYSFREPGTGYSTYRTLTKSVQLHGKLWWDENDYYTNLTPSSSWVEGWTGPRTFHTTQMQQIRQLSNQIMHASAGWWFDMSGGWFDSVESMDMISRLNDIAERSVHANRESVSEIAVVVDEKSLLYLAMNGELYRPLIMEQRMPVGKIGAPVDWILMDDLEQAPDYKMYVFLNAFHVTGKQKAALNRLHQNGAKAVVWVYAPGYVGDTLDVNGCFDLTGIRLKSLDDKSPLHVEISVHGENVLPGVSAGSMYGTSNKIGPVIVGDDPFAELLGTLYGFGEQGLITKVVNGVQVYFSAAPVISSSVLRGIAEKAGVHIYGKNNDVLYVNKSFIGIHTPRSGERILHFPKPTDLYDVYNNRTVAVQATEVILDLPVRHSVLHFMGTKQEWDDLKK
ncbi:beta-galactosidase [Candidatus Latescibacterota bacterium]